MISENSHRNSAIPVRFSFCPGIPRDIFHNVRLAGSWDDGGRYAPDWSVTDMEKETGEDGCPCFVAVVHFAPSQLGTHFHWGIIVDGPGGKGMWAIAAEVAEPDAADRYRSFRLAPDIRQEYRLTRLRLLGAQKYFPAAGKAALRFAVWAPNAQNVEAVFGGQSGYIADDGSGIEGPPVPLIRHGNLWLSDADRTPEYATFVRRPYMFRIVREQGDITYRTDIYSRSQMGRGEFDPEGRPYTGNPAQLDGSVSCSVVTDPELVAKDFDATAFVPADEFWSDEFTGDLVPSRVEDLVIYEFHVGSLGFPSESPGTFRDALGILDYLVDLGINAVELMPISEFEGWVHWGYGTSHYFAIEASAGGEDQLKHFVKACHRRGIAVILDVVYNHYAHEALRAEWAYDSDADNIYYWYEGSPGDYPEPDWGYVENGASGYAPRYREEMVRSMFIDSAVALVEEFHIDGFRVDLTEAIHRDNRLRGDGRPVPAANIFGAKFLREWSQTLKLIRPGVILIAEDHSRWDKVTRPVDELGLGFGACWHSDFCHHLVGESSLIKMAGYGDDRPLAMDRFAAVLEEAADHKIVYVESHDEAGNAPHSKRTIEVAVNSAPLVGETRRFAEARCRFAFGMTVLSPGTPLFFMGEEIGARKVYTYRDFLQNKEDLAGERQGEGRYLFRFYQDILRFRLIHPAIRSRHVEIVCVDNARRIIGFIRRSPGQEFLILGSLLNQPVGCVLENLPLPDSQWREVFNSDSSFYGGTDTGNHGGILPVIRRRLQLTIPSAGFVVLQREPDSQ